MPVYATLVRCGAKTSGRYDEEICEAKTNTVQVKSASRSNYVRHFESPALNICEICRFVVENR